MNWSGKLIGAVLGFILAGPFGMVLGLVIGQYFDSAAGFPGSRQQSLTQRAFFRVTFLVMGHVAKADGRVSESEIRAARSIMHSMQLSSNMKQEAIALFTEGKSASFILDNAMRELQHYCGNQPNLLRMFLEIQFRAAAAEGDINITKRRILEKLCQRLRFNAEDFFFFRSQQQHSHYQQHQQQRQHYRQPPPQKSSLDQAYAMLGIAASVPDAEVKKAYRKQMSRNHPDKLVAKGLPEEMIKIATEKTQEIKAAYEQICKARGI